MELLADVPVEPLPHGALNNGCPNQCSVAGLSNLVKCRSSCSIVAHFVVQFVAECAQAGPNCPTQWQRNQLKTCEPVGESKFQQTPPQVTTQISSEGGTETRVGQKTGI